MFSSIKMEEYMESETSCIFLVKLIVKNIVLGSPKTHFMRMRVKRRKITNLNFVSDVILINTQLALQLTQLKKQLTLFLLIFITTGKQFY